MSAKRKLHRNFFERFLFHDKHMYKDLDRHREAAESFIRNARTELLREIDDDEERTESDWTSKIDDDMKVLDHELVKEVGKGHDEINDKMRKELNGFQSQLNEAETKFDSQMDKEMERVSRAARVNLTKHKATTLEKGKELRSELNQLVSGKDRNSRHHMGQIIKEAQDRTKVHFSSQMDEKFDDLNKAMSKQKGELQKMIKDGDAKLKRDLQDPVEDLLKLRGMTKMTHFLFRCVRASLQRGSVRRSVRP